MNMACWRILAVLASRTRPNTGSWLGDRMAELLAFGIIAALLIAFKIGLTVLKSTFGKKEAKSS